MDMLRGGWGPGLLGNGQGTVGAGSSYQAETEAIAAAFTTPPTTARKDLIDAAVVALKAAGVWAKLDALYAFAAADSQAAKINWIAPGTFNCTEVNAPTFTADQGFNGASTKYLDSNFNMSTAPSPQFTQNSAAVFAWSLTSTDIIGGLIGTAGADTQNAILPRLSNQAYFAVNNTGTLFNIQASTDASGLWLGNRTSSADITSYRNGASLGSFANTSAVFLNTTLVFLKRQSQYWTGQIAAGGFGSQLSAADNTALYNALAAYMAGLATDRIAAAFTTPPSAARKTLIQNCVTSLMQGGVWTKLDTLYAFAAADAQAAKINWKNPGTYNCTEVNAPTFTADSGFLSAATKYIDSGFNPATATTPQYVQNSAAVSGWSLTNVDTGTHLFAISVGWNFLQPKAGGSYWAAINSTNQSTAANADSTGLFTVTRTSSSSLSVYKNGSLLNAHTDTSVAVSNAVIKFANTWPGTIASGAISSQLSAAENTALYNALRTYLTGVGVP